MSCLCDNLVTTCLLDLVVSMEGMHSYTGRYLDRMTVQSALHFTPAQAQLGQGKGPRARQSQDPGQEPGMADLFIKTAIFKLNFSVSALGSIQPH